MFNAPTGTNLFQDMPGLRSRLPQIPKPVPKPSLTPKRVRPPKPRKPPEIGMSSRDRGIVRAVSDHFGTAMKDVTDKKAKRPTFEVAQARHVAMYALRMAQKHSLHKIGILFGRDHTVALYACRKVASSPELKAIADEIAANHKKSETPVAGYVA